MDPNIPANHECGDRIVDPGEDCEEMPDFPRVGAVGDIVVLVATRDPD